MKSSLRCEHYSCDVLKAATKPGGWLTATEHAHHDDVALCVECITQYSLMENDYLEHAWHTLVAIMQQAMVNELDVSAPMVLADLAAAVAGLTTEIGRNADRRAAYQLAKGKG